MNPRLIILSNRLPVAVKKVDGKLEFVSNAGGGLATGLARYAEDSRNRWIGWPGIPNEDLNDEERRIITEKLDSMNCQPVFLTKRQINKFYSGYSNGILWPLMHDNPISKESLDQRDDWFKTYLQVNERYAAAVLELASDSSTIWVHDYLLMLVPALLRRELPDGRIGFFLHTPWPQAKDFIKLVDAEAVVAGLLGADLIGMHTVGYVNNFLDTVQRLELGNIDHKKVLLGERAIRVTDFPIGIDYEKYEKARKSRAVTRELAKLRLQYAGLKVILTVDRLDPSKGLVERARAYQTLLRENPPLRGKVVMVMLVVPSRLDVPEYQHLKEELEMVIDETNREFGMMPWIPIDYMFTALPFEQVTALYRRADIAFITPLRDGMNLVAKEYLASKPYQRGVLVLSRTAGAAQELKDAVMVDPRRPETLVKGLRKALNMKPEELKRRVGHMQELLSTATVQRWAGNFMRTLKQDNLPNRTWTLTAPKQRIVIEAYRRAKTRLLLLDYDGVLAPIVDLPEDAKPAKRLRNVLSRLGEDERNSVVIASGRDRGSLDRWLGDLPVNLVAEHGVFTKKHDGKQWRVTPTNAVPGWQDKIRPLLERYAAKVPGAFVEEKSAALVWHYRKGSAYNSQKYLVSLKRELQKLAQRYRLEARQGKKIIEVRSNDVNKGTAAAGWMEELEPDFVMALGDDYTDEDAFKVLPSYAYTIKIGRGHTAAIWRLATTDEALGLLEKLSKS